MHSAGARITLRAREAGPVAWRAVRREQAGALHSIFTRSAYLALGDALVCIGPHGLGNGALHLLCEPWPDHVALDALIAPGDSIVGDGSCIRIGALAISLADAVAWRPAQEPAWNAETLKRGVDIAVATTRGAPPEGLAPLLGHAARGTAPLPPIARAASEPAQYLGALAEAATRGRPWRVDSERITPLLGLGPGLTPSGDDYLAGFLIALTRLRLLPLRDAIWLAIGPHAAALTNAISCAHLAAAAEGFGHAALHALIDAILAGDAASIGGSVRTVTAIGHTSGWDALTGALAALESCAFAPTPAAADAPR